MTEDDEEDEKYMGLFDNIAFDSEELQRILLEKYDEGPSFILLFDEAGPRRGPPYFPTPWWCPLCGHDLTEHHNGRCYRASFLYDRGAHRPPRVMMCPCGRLP